MIPQVKEVNNAGACGVEQFLVSKEVAFNATGIDAHIDMLTIPAGCLLTHVGVFVNEAFDAATTNVLTVGDEDTNVNTLLAASDVTEGTIGYYGKHVGVYCTTAKTLKIKYTQSGTAAAHGKAQVFAGYVRLGK